MPTIDNKRVAKNAFALYFRMFFTMGVTIYTSRVILNALGVEDYGIYNVAGGLISLFTFVNSSMNSTTQRYLNFALGKGEMVYVKRVFNTAIQQQIVISFFVLLLAETVGLWFFNEKMVIPDERRNAAMWVYQISLLSSLLTFIFVPYTSVIIAREKMTVFAYMSILTVTLRLTIAFLLLVSPWDRMIFYAVMHLMLELSIKLAYVRYCFKHFEEASLIRVFDQKLFKEMFGFAGWSFFGLFSSVMCSQGINMMLNVFFGPIVNAARGVANQVQIAVKEFVGNFQAAINPQITKTYANGELEKMHNLMYRSAKFSYFLLWIIILPIMLETDFLLKIWLKIVPDNAVIFTRLIMLISLVYAISNPCLIANQASGKVKNYQLISSTILIMALPCSYFLLSFNYPPYSVFLVQLFFEIVALISQMLLMRSIVNLNINRFIIKVALPIVVVTIVSSIAPFIIYINNQSCFIRLIVVCMTAVASVAIVTYSIGLTKEERSFIENIIKSKLSSKLHIHK